MNILGLISQLIGIETLRLTKMILQRIRLSDWFENSKILIFHKKKITNINNFVFENHQHAWVLKSYIFNIK